MHKQYLNMNQEESAMKSLPKLKARKEVSFPQQALVSPEQKSDMETDTNRLLKVGSNTTNDSSIVMKSNDNLPRSDEGVNVPGDDDILSGRGAGVNLHQGNVFFRKLIHAHEEQYVNADPGEKKRLIKKIVQIASDGRRFLKYDSGTDLWISLPDEDIKKKVGQALREKAPVIKKQHNQEILKKKMELHGACYNGVPNLMIPPLNYSPPAQTVTSSRFLPQHHQNQYAIRRILTQMKELEEKQFQLKRKQREVEDEQNKLLQHFYEMAASLNKPSSVDILLEAAANKSRFERESDGFSIPVSPKKRRITTAWH